MRRRSALVFSLALAALAPPAALAQSDSVSIDEIERARKAVQVDPSCDLRRIEVAVALGAAVEQGAFCLLQRNGAGLVRRYLDHLERERPKLLCPDEERFREALAEIEAEGARPPGHGADACGVGETAQPPDCLPGRRVWLPPPAFDEPRCAPLSATIFHELLHNLGVATADPHAEGAAGDGVYGCEQVCFGGGSASTNERDACLNAMPVFEGCRGAEPPAGGDAGE